MTSVFCYHHVNRGWSKPAFSDARYDRYESYSLEEYIELKGYMRYRYSMGSMEVLGRGHVVGRLLCWSVTMKRCGMVSGC
jgi:hypothetical protein